MYMYMYMYMYMCMCKLRIDAPRNMWMCVRIMVHACPLPCDVRCAKSNFCHFR